MQPPASPWRALERPVCRDQHYRAGDADDSKPKQRLFAANTDRSAESHVNDADECEDVSESQNLSELNPDIESEERNDNVADEQTLQVAAESCAMYEAEDCRENGPVRAAKRRARAVSHDDVLDARGDYREWNQILDYLLAEWQVTEDCGRETDRMSHRERGDDPHDLAPLREPVDHGERQQEKDVIHRA